MKPLCQSVEIQAPVLGAIRSIVRAKMTTILNHVVLGEAGRFYSFSDRGLL